MRKKNKFYSCSRTKYTEVYLLFFSFFESFDGLDFPALHNAMIAVMATRPKPATPICQIHGCSVKVSKVNATLTFIIWTAKSTNSSL